MTGLLISLSILLATAGATAFAIKRFGSAAPGEKPGYVYPEAQRLAYRAMARLRDSADEQMLERYPALKKSLRSRRRRVLAVYLGQIENEFSTACARARELAAQSDDPAAASRVLQQEMRFRLAHFALKSQGLFGIDWGARAVQVVERLDDMELGAAEREPVARDARSATA